MLWDVEFWRVTWNIKKSSTIQEIKIPVLQGEFKYDQESVCCSVGVVKVG